MVRRIDKSGDANDARLSVGTSGSGSDNPRVRLRDVAARARVALATASRALTAGAPVSEAMRARVERAAAELGYVPDGAARALASGQWRTVGAIVPSLENSGFAIAVEALQQRLDAAGLTLLLASSGYDASRELREVRALLSRGIDGLVLVGSLRDPETTTLLERSQVPVVQTWTLVPGQACVGFDNAGAARLLTEYLLDLGHRDIGVIAGLTRGNDRAAERVTGVRLTLERRGLALPRERLIERPYRILEGQIAMRALLAARPRPTAVICGNDQLAFGALVEAQGQGIAVPQAMSITGFNDLDFASFSSPPLTTIRVPAAEIGDRAGQFLIDRLAGITTPEIVEIQTTLVVRGSTGPPPRSL